jgi:hypothetical protein
MDNARDTIRALKRNFLRGLIEVVHFALAEDIRRNDVELNYFRVSAMLSKLYGRVTAQVNNLDRLLRKDGEYKR